MISAPRSMPTRSTRNSISSPGSTMPRKREVQPTSRAGGVARPSVAVTTCCAAAESHMPCTMGDFSPASSAAARSVWIGLWSPETTANALMSLGAVTVTSRRRRRGVSVALSVTAPPARGRIGQLDRTGAAADGETLLEGGQYGDLVVASRSSPRPGRRDRPRCRRRRSRCGDGQFALRRRHGDSRCAAWSRCTRLSRPSTTGKPVSVTAEPMAENTAGQHGRPAASGTNGERRAPAGRRTSR